MIERIIWIVLDSVGIGEMPDATEYGDVGSNTLGNISKAVGGLDLPNMRKLGLGNIDGILGVQKVENPVGCFARMAERSKGKDTTTGHWEMTGVHSENGFPVYPNGFPDRILNALEKVTGRKSICNKPMSGTVVIEQYGEEHMKTGNLIIYTSADSVFQIAAHEDIISIEEQYDICEKAREILSGDDAVARIIARPFEGHPGNFARTSNRRDFSLVPPHDTVLDHLKVADLNVMAVGKIEDIFSGKGITEAIHTKSNSDGMKQTLNYMKENKKGLIFTNLVDFDMKWGHRNNVEGYAKGLEEFDRELSQVLNEMKYTDVLFITADHGCDPTTDSTDHSREYVPFLAYGKALKSGVNLKTRKTFSDIGQTIADIFELKPILNGDSFLSEIKK